MPPDSLPLSIAMSSSSQVVSPRRKLIQHSTQALKSKGKSNCAMTDSLRTFIPVDNDEFMERMVDYINQSIVSDVSILYFTILQQILKFVYINQ